MENIIRPYLLSLTLCLATGALASCSRAMSDIDQFSDCKNICGRYKECFATDYDTHACEDRCRSRDHHDGTSVVDHCRDCIADRSCTKATFACATECVGIVP